MASFTTETLSADPSRDRSSSNRRMRRHCAATDAASPARRPANIANDTAGDTLTRPEVKARAPACQ